MSEWAAVLATALDEVEYGIVLLDKDLEAQFINRAYYRMWSLAPPPEGATYNFIDLVEHARATAAYDVGSQAIDEYVRNRIALVRSGSHPPLQLKMADGRALKIECIALPDGGRMLTYADISDLVQAADRLRALATTDDLTKLFNRRHFLALLDDAFKRALHDDLGLSIVMIDADHFKEINDSHGHLVGDEVLRALAYRCRTFVRKGDALGRLGGEEFAVILGDTDGIGALNTAERLRRGVAGKPFRVGNERLTVTVSVGVAARKAKETDPGQLLRLADHALYSAKAGGRNRIAVDLGQPPAMPSQDVDDRA